MFFNFSYIVKFLVLSKREQCKTDFFLIFIYCQLDSLMRELEEGGDELQSLESLNQTLISKERTTNVELQDARKALIRVRLM